MSEIQAAAWLMSSTLFCAVCFLWYIGAELALDTLPRVSTLEWLAPVYFGQHRASLIPAPLAITAGPAS